MLFWQHVLFSDGCWEWQAGKFTTGYGSYKDRGKTRLAHRVAWFLWHGTWPTDFVCHPCDNPLCVRPDHLFEGTNQDNQLDARDKGRLHPWNRDLTHCVHGHCYETDGVYWWKNRRYCKPCVAANQRAYQTRKKQAAS